MCKAVEFLLINNEIRIVVGLIVVGLYYSRIEYTKSTKYIFKQANNFSAMFSVKFCAHANTIFAK